MKASRIALVVAVIAIATLVGIYAFDALLAPSTKSTSSLWSGAAGYPIQVSGTPGIAGEQCFNSTSYIVCIGGGDANGGPRSEVYTSSAISPSSTNVTFWTRDTNEYPQSINGQSCVAYSGYVYCVGGTYDDGGDDVASGYYAQLRGDGAVGAWGQTTPFPIPIDSQSCVASSGYIYCVGGNNETDGSNVDAAESSSVWYAQLSSSGIGPWSASTAYPGGIYFPTCYTSDGFIYCVGGADSNDNPVNTDFFAPLSSAGVGAWTQTTAYPVQASGQACVTSSGEIYCVGGEGSLNTYTGGVYYASVSSGGIGAWKQATGYPIEVQTACAISSGQIYCVGGFDASSSGEDNSVYYASLASLTR